MTVLRMCELGHVSRASLYRFAPEAEHTDQDIALRDAAVRLFASFLEVLIDLLDYLLRQRRYRYTGRVLALRNGVAAIAGAAGGIGGVGGTFEQVSLDKLKAPRA